MRGPDHTVVVLAVAVLLGAAWTASSEDAMSAQSGTVRDCHFTLFADGYQATNVRRPVVFLLDECTGTRGCSSVTIWVASVVRASVKRA